MWWTGFELLNKYLKNARFYSSLRYTDTTPFWAYFQKIHFEIGEKATYIRGYLAFKPLNIIKNYLITFSSDIF